MTVKLPEKAGFVATTKEWDDLVRIAENLAAQVVQRDAALRQMQSERDAAQSSAGFWGRSCAKIMAERDAAREHAERQQLSKDGLYRELREMSSQRDAARAEAALLTDNVNDLGDAIGEALIYASGKTEQILRRALGDDDAALRQPAPAPAQGQE